MEQWIVDWVNRSPADQVDFRKAVHIILMAVSLDGDLSKSMVMKGGILLGIRYGSSRYTTDIDFSTSEKMVELDEDEMRDKINMRLFEAEAELLYGIKCSVQKLKKIPKRADATFPSLDITIGYARKNNDSMMSRLERGQSSQVVQIDYSFNEFTGTTQEIEIDGDECIQAYDLVSLLAEKFRSILQQVVRNRSRRQDVYDIYYLIDRFAEGSDEEKAMVLEMLLEKSIGKDIDEFLNVNGMDDERVISRSSENFNDMEDEIEGELPGFEDSYAVVRSYYKTMPWETV